MRPYVRGKMEDLYNSAVQEATAAFWHGGVVIWKTLIENEPRHIEIQISRRSYGKACPPSEGTALFNVAIKNKRRDPFPLL